MNVLIIGGVAAGASTAARLRRLDEQARITIIERGQHVSFANCGLPYHIGGAIKDRERLLLQTPESLKASLNLDVRIGEEAIRVNRQSRTVSIRRADGTAYDEPYDKLVLCPGAAPIVPKLPGVDHPRVFVLRNIDDMDAIKAAADGGAKKAVVVGGGYIGIEMAESLVERGIEVDLVELTNQLMPVMDGEMTYPLENHARAKGVRLHLGTAAAAFRDHSGRVVAELNDNTVLEADFAIMSVGVRPDSSLARDAGLDLGPRGGIKVDDRMRTSDPDIYAAGDAVEVVDAVLGAGAFIPLAGPANRQGRIVAENLAGRDTRYRATQGTAIVKVFDMAAGCTGASEKALAKAGIPYRKVHLHPSGHASYYPGTAPMHLKLLYAPDTGRILGAQVVGFDGVDKRIDVFATALRAGLTVRDLQHLELSYAPPFGSAKDPVNMAGFVATNVLQGDLDLWYAEDYPARTEGASLVDVRSPDEYAEWHIPGAANIPLATLRSRLGELSRDKPVFVYCKVGFRSYLAYRVLRQNGFKAASLAGGALTFCMTHHRRVCVPGEKVDAPSYAEEKIARPPAPSGKRIEIDACGLQCPGPIMRLKDAMAGLAAGDELVVSASDPGFAADAPAWCRRNGHALVDLQAAGPVIRATIRKGLAPDVASGGGAPTRRTNRKTILVFSGDLDKAFASFIIANGCTSMGSQVTMFFTFWGLNILRRSGPQAPGKGLLDFMFGWMMPKGPDSLTLSKMNMMGMGTALMKKVMRDKKVSSLPELIGAARLAGVRLVACTMSMDVMGIRKEELIDGVELGGVASFLADVDDSDTTFVM